MCVRRRKQNRRCAAVLVFGDIGRSPRIQNHAYELTKMTDYFVYLIGFQGIIHIFHLLSRKQTL